MKTLESRPQAQAQPEVQAQADALAAWQQDPNSRPEQLQAAEEAGSQERAEQAGQPAPQPLPAPEWMPPHLARDAPIYPAAAG